MRKTILWFAVAASLLAFACTEEVNLPPDVVLEGPDVVRINTAVVFDASKTADRDGYVKLDTFTFDFGDGSEKLKGVSSASHTFTKKGDFVVSVEASDDKGASAKASKLVTVADNVTPVARLSGPNLVRKGAEAVFDAGASTDSDGSIKDYSFDFGDGTTKVTGVSSVSHVFAACKGDKYPCAYTVTVEVTDNDGAKSTASVQVTVTGNVVPVASLKGPSAGRINQLLSFDASASTDADGTITGYSFDFGDGAAKVSGVQTAQHAYTAKGSYTVALEVTDNDGAKSTASIQVTIMDNVPPVASIKGPSIARIKQVVSFDASASSDPDGKIADYSFDFGDGTPAVTGAQIAQHSFATAGPYVVKVEVTDNDGAKASASVQILVTPNIVPVAAFTGPATAVVGDVVTFDASASTDADGTITAYSFDFGDGTPAGTNVQSNHVYAAQGVYTVALKVTDNDGAENTSTRQITVSSVAASATSPIASFTSPARALINQAVSFDGSASLPGSGQITSYSWEFGDSATGSGATATHVYTAVGIYNVSLTVLSTQKDGTTVLTNKMTRQISIEDNTVSITSITPGQGSVSGGTVVTVKGKGFTKTGLTTLQFGGNNALAVDVVDGTTMTAVTPPGVPGPADVFLANDNGSTILAQGFTYLGAANRASAVFCPVALVAGGNSAGFAANDDDVNLPVALPFDFEFFGKVYTTGTQIRVTTNGWMSFNDTGASFTPFAIPSGSNPATMIAPFFQDLTAGATGQAYTLTTGAAPNRQFAVAWRDFTARSANSDRYSFEVILYESSNDIKFQYLNTYGGTFASGSSATAGIQGSPVDGLQAFRNTATSGLAPGGRTYVFSYANGAYSPATDSTLSVFSTNPANNGNMGTNGSFTINFSVPVNPSTITGANVQLYDVTTSTSVNVGFAVSGDKLSITGTPTTALTVDDRYRVTVTTNVYGANKVQFSQDPTKVACGAASNPTSFTFEFTAIVGVADRFNLGTGSTPQGIVHSPTSNVAYIAKGGSNRAVVFNTSNYTVSNNIGLSDCTNPMGVAITPNGQKVFMTCYNGTGRVAVIDTAGFTQIDVNGGVPGVQSITVGSNPDGIAIRATGDRAYVANRNSNTISVIDTSTYGVTTTIGVGNAPRGAVVNPAGTRLFVAEENNNDVAVIDVQNGSGSENTVLQYVDVSAACSAPRGVAVRPDGSRLYVTCNGNDTVVVVDAATYNVIDAIGVGAQPIGIAVSSNGRLAYVAERGDNAAGIINLDTNAYLGQVWLNGGNGPFGVTFKPNSSIGLITLSNSNEVGVVY